MKDIKKLAPTGGYDSGAYQPSAFKKCKSAGPVILRSSYEKAFVRRIEADERVQSWGSECVAIKYKDALGKEHTYWPDFVVKRDDGVFLVEIKPKCQTAEPPANAALSVHEAWEKNKRKWAAAGEFASSHGCRFIILTEKSLF